jgi:NADH-quinone oxidoreductase subunit J
MTFTFCILGALTLAGAIAAMSLRNLIHCALCLAVAFAGLAGFYLQLDAQFAGFAQVLVYVGAVAILTVFAVLLTRGSEPANESIFSTRWWVGLGVTAAVFAVIASAILGSKALEPGALSPTPAARVRDLGDQLMTRYVLPLEVLGLLLTAALIGAVIIAAQDSPPEGGKTK